ncbi:hypothetical protein LUZ60_010384 [Juncus effusus]|nr:hypothetical protein LUZ60_010384 [Juncus effusus]
MAKRPDLNSDFSQKLLGDIRRRKEKLGFGSSNTQADCHKSFRGSRETAKNNNLLQQNNNNTTVKPNNNKGFSSPKRNNKSQITPKTSSQEIVPFRKDKNPVRDKIDVSMALALALSKTGKLQNIELLSRTKIGTDFVTHRGTIQFSNLNSNRQFMSNGSQYLFLPEFGVEKLHEMINAYTRNRNFRDLEECLNMLIMMQDAQDYMVGSKSSNNNYNNSRVLLLKDKKDNENESRNKSKNQNKLEKNGMNAGRNKKQGNNLLAVSNSKSCDIYNCNNSNKNNSDCNNKRMPGLVARLMGLEEFPQPVKSNVEIKEVETEIKNEILHDKNTNNGKNIERITTKPPSKRETRLERMTRSYIDDKRGYLEKSTNNREKSKPKKIEEKALVVKPSVEMKLRDKYYSYLNNGDKKNTTSAPKKFVKFECVNKDLGKKGSNSIPSQKKKNSSTLSSSKINNTKNHKGLENGCKIGEKIIEIDQNLKEIKKKIEQEFESKLENFGEINAEKYANIETNSSDDRILNTETFNKNGDKIIEIDENLNEIKKNIEEFESKIESFEENNVKKDANIETKSSDDRILNTKTFNKNGDKIIDIDQNLKEIKKKIEEEFEAKLENFEENNAKKDTNNETKTPDDRILNTETIDCIDLNSTVVDAQEIIQVPFLEEQEFKLHEQIDSCNYIKETRNLFSDEDLLTENQILNTETTNCKDITSTDIDTHQIIQFPSLKEELKLQDSVNEQIDSCNYIKESKNLYSDEDLLNEDQILLKENLLKDTQFLDLAQKISKIEIPLDTPPFQEVTKTPLDKESDTVLFHTVHGILKRKGEKYDLFCTNFKFHNLNSLIKELDSDLKSLEFKSDREFVEVLQQMLEREIGGRNSDSNCMWEFGWNLKHFARCEKFEIAKDLEKHLVSGLITEFTEDLIEEILLI